jgi:hypothetical protein
MNWDNVQRKWRICSKVLGSEFKGKCYAKSRRVCQKHVTVFEIGKPACSLSAASILIVIMYSDVWSLVEMECWSMQHRVAAVELFIRTVRYS